MDARPAREWLIRSVTSRSLGALAPGYAASDRGIRTYAAIVRSFGLIVVSLWILGLSVEIGGVLLLAGTGAFVIFSVKAIRGEVTTYRDLKR